MATALQPYDYQPVPVSPPGGLLASAVGDPLAPAPPIDPNTYENDDVVGQLNAITAADSGYMQLARTSGLQTANKRGLLNSSLAAGASQAAAIAAAAPLASQNAAQSAQRNQTRLQAHFTGEQQRVDIEARDKMLNEQLRSEEERLGRQLTSQELQQQRDIANRLQMQVADIMSQQFMQERQIGATQQITQMNIDAESERLGRQLTAAEQQQIRDLSAQQARLQLQLDVQSTLTREGYATDIARANLDATTRVQLANIQNLSENQRAALSYYLAQDQIYAQSVGNLYANKDMPTPARDQAMSLFLALRNSNINMPAILFGTTTTWGGIPTGTPTGGTPTGTTPTGTFTPPAGTGTGNINYYTGPSADDISAMWNDGIAGNARTATTAYNAWQTTNNNGAGLLTRL